MSFLVTGRMPGRPPHWPDSDHQTGIAICDTRGSAVIAADKAIAEGWKDVIVWVPDPKENDDAERELMETERLKLGQKYLVK
jgi:hypothetical protein